MSDRAYAKVQVQQKTLTGSSPGSSLLQRKCACGGSPGIDGLCAECRDKRVTLRSSQKDLVAPSVSAAVQGNSSAQETIPSLSAAVGRASHFGHDFSRIPVYPSHLPVLQTKLQVNRPGDIYEQEADQVAEQVMRMADPKSPKGQAPNLSRSNNHRGIIQLSPAPQSKQTKAGNFLLKHQGQPEKDRWINLNDQELTNNYVDSHMIKTYITFIDGTNLDNVDHSRVQVLVVEYANGHRVSFKIDDIPLIKGPNPGSKPGEIKINILPQWFEMRDGIIYPIDSLGRIAFSRLNTPNLIGLRLDAYERIEGLRKLSTLRDLTDRFAKLIAINIGASAASHQIASTSPTPGRRVSLPKGGAGKGKQVSTPDIETEIDEAFKTLPEADPHSGATKDPKSRIRSGVMIGGEPQPKGQSREGIPASKDPKAGPPEVLDVGAGTQRPNLGLPPERQLVAVTSSDISETARPDVILDATQSIPKNLQGRFTTLIINNPYGYEPNIGEMKQALTSGGKIIVQGNWEANKYFRRLGTASVPPNMTRTIERNLPPSAILGEGFRTSSGDKPVQPNARITFEVTNPTRSYGPAVH